MAYSTESKVNAHSDSERRRNSPGRSSRNDNLSSKSNFRGNRKTSESRTSSGRSGYRPAPSPVKVSPSYAEYEFTQPAADDNSPNLENDRYILTGRNPIREALKTNRDLEKLLVQKGELSGSALEIVQTAKNRKIPVQVVEKSRLDEITPVHQGLIAFASAFQYSTVDDMLSIAAQRNEDPFLILLDGITDPHNLGAIIRSAECAGAHGVIVPVHRSVGLTPAAVKASAGAVEYIPVARVNNINRTIEELKEKNIWIYALTMNGQDYETVSFSGGTAIVIGSEGNGISKLTEEKCDLAVSLPLMGKIDSLNASVAAGIMMYKILASRRNK